MPDRALTPVVRTHLDELTGPLGIWQHASGSTPDESFGYCSDDVARALTLDLLHRRSVGWETVSERAWRSLAFLRAAFEPTTGRFRNFRADDGTWLDDGASQDCQGRVMLALGIALRDAPEVPMRLEAARLFGDALPGARRLTSPRAVASAMLGCDAALASGMEGPVLRTFQQVARRLAGPFRGLALEGGWPWPEAVLTYENALLPHALIVAGGRLRDPALAATGLRVLDWLVGVQTSRTGAFSPVGNDGWWPRGGLRARFEQQPIEATATILAAAAAFEATGADRYRRAAEAAYGWFLGDNDVGIPVAIPATGACHDGLAMRGVNRNQGAESTLMWLTALETIRDMRRRHASTAMAGVRTTVRPATAAPARGLRP